MFVLPGRAVQALIVWIRSQPTWAQDEKGPQDKANTLFTSQWPKRAHEHGLVDHANKQSCGRQERTEQ